MLNAVPLERILLESDAPDGLPNSELESLIPLDSDSLAHERSSTSDTKETEPLNHPANVQAVLNYVARLLEMPTEELADRSYQNSLQVFSF